MTFDAPHPNRTALQRFLATVLDIAEDKPAEQAEAVLRANARHLRRLLRQLDAWAAGQGDAPCPPHLNGLDAFTLADAADQLEAEAWRRAGASVAAG